jgi:hypothetical protein
MEQIIYASAAAVPFGDADLKRLLERARERNAAVDVTGLLVFHEGSFLQVLEGDADAVQTLFARISKDDRHDRVRLVLRRSVEEREFAEWSMGFVRLEPGANVPGVVDVFRDGRAIDTIAENPGRAVELVLRFREGRWRQSASVS